MSSEEEVRAKLEAMDVDAIIEFMKQKGNVRKQKVHANMRFQTRDAEHSAKFAAEYKAEVAHKVEMMESMGGEADKFAEQEADINQRIEETTTQINDLTAAQETAAEGGCITDADLIPLLDRITPQLLKLINETLEVEKPKVVTDALEHFVGMIRNVTKATNVDVELYMASHPKLILKLQKLMKDVQGLSSKNVTLHLEELTKISTSEGFSDIGDLDKKAKRKDFKENHIFPIVEFGRLFGEMAAHQLAQQEKKAEIDSLSNDLNILKLQQERLNHMKGDMEDLNVNEIFQQTVEAAQAREEAFDQMQQLDSEQAEQTQMQYHHFEAEYFAELDKLLAEKRGEPFEEGA